MKRDGYPWAIRELFRREGRGDRKAWEAKLREAHACGRLTCPLTREHLLRKCGGLGEERGKVPAPDPDPMPPLDGAEPALLNPAVDRGPADARGAGDLGDREEFAGLREWSVIRHQLPLYPGLRLAAD